MSHTKGMDMNERRRIEERAKQKELEIQELEARWRDAKIYLQALQDVLKILPRDNSPALGAKTLRMGSAVSKAHEVMLKLGRPAHVTELLEALGQAVNRESRASLASSLASYVRRGEIFSRTAPNTFGLLELGHPNEPEDGATEPPEDFGIDATSPEDEEIPVRSDIHA